MKHSLRVKLTASFLALTALVFLVVGVVANVLLDRQFTAYVIGRQQQRIDAIAALLAERAGQWGGKWDANAVEAIGMNALGDGLILRLEDQAGKTVWDAMEHNGGMCAALLQKMAANMASHSPGFQGGYAEQSHSIAAHGLQVGTAHIGYYGPYSFSDNELAFLETLNNLLLWAALAASAVSAVFGLVMAGRLSGPIRRVIGAAGRIAGGDYTGRVRELSTTKEIVELAETVNSLAETLGRQDALRKRLTADLAHELRTPIATLQSHLEAMAEGIWKPERDRLQSCHEETVRLAKLVGDLELLTSAEDRAAELHPSPFDLSALLKRIVTNFEERFRERGVGLALEPREIWVEADEDRISQVFVNIVDNALKYTQAGGVAIEMENPPGVAVVRVRDTGIGIPQEDLPNIFERLYRSDTSRSRLTGGSGIGLAIARAIVEEHGGTIAAASEPGRGSVFTVSLPTVMDQRPESPPE